MRTSNGAGNWVTPASRFHQLWTIRTEQASIPAELHDCPTFRNQFSFLFTLRVDVPGGFGSSNKKGGSTVTVKKANSIVCSLPTAIAARLVISATSTFLRGLYLSGKIRDAHCRPDSSHFAALYLRGYFRSFSCRALSDTHRTCSSLLTCPSR